MSSSSASSSSPNLPEEIWGKVFSYLYLEDLKSVRLTNHLFYDVCNTSTIHKNEEFVFPAKVDTETIKSLINMNRKKWNIKLNRVDLASMREPIVQFLQKHGANICSLTLVECYDCEPGTLPVIIEHCESVRNFTVYFSKLKIGTNSDGIFAGFETLQMNNIVRKNVVSLTLIETYENYINCMWFQVLTNANFLSIFSVFPNIKELKIVCNTHEWFDEFDTNLSELIEKKLFTFSSIYYQLYKMRDQLEKLKLHLMYDIEEATHSAECLHKISHIEMKNLKELSLNWPNLWGTSIENPFLRFNHLTEIKCFIGDSFPISKSDFIRLLIENSKELRYLHILTTECVCMDKECFIALVTSHLTTLIIYRIYNYGRFAGSNADIFYDGDENIIDYIGPGSIAANFERPSLENFLIPNYTLKDLKVHTSDKNMNSLLSTYFQCLDNVKNYEVTTLLTGILGKYF